VRIDPSKIAALEWCTQKTIMDRSQMGSALVLYICNLSVEGFCRYMSFGRAEYADRICDSHQENRKADHPVQMLAACPFKRTARNLR